MRNRNDVKALINEMMTDKLDLIFEQNGFLRKKNSMNYSRTINEAKQKIEITFFSSPSYVEGADAHIYPNLTVIIPSVSKIAIEMAGDRWLLANSPDITLRQPVDLVAPKEFHTRWFAKGDNWKEVVGSSMIDFFQKWVFEFLDNYSTPLDIVSCYEKQDGRVMRQEFRYIYIAAAYLALDDSKNALEVLEKRFASKVAIIKYAHAFEYIRQWQTKS